VTTTQAMAFAAAIGLGAMSPGPDFAVVVRHAVTSGRRAGLATAAGVAAGILVWVFAATTGVAALLAASATAFTVVKVIGAGYLLFLGVRALRSAARHPGTAPDPTAGRPATTAVAAFRSGLLCNVLNPKAAVFFVALMPQFLPHHPAVSDVLLLSMTAFVITLLWFGTVAAVVSGLRRLLARPAIRRTIDGLTGNALVLLGVRLAATRT
jgi:RhtB (resistance to homoserine/threonine) family protein